MVGEVEKAWSGNAAGHHGMCGGQAQAGMRVLARDCRKPRFERAPAMQPRALLCFCLLGILAALVPCTVCLDFGITKVTAITLDSVLGADTEMCGMFNSSSTVPCRSPEFGFAQAHRQVCTAE